MSFILPVLLGISLTFSVVFFVLFILKQKQFMFLTKSSRDSEEALNRKLFESRVFEELNDRLGYSLDIKRIIDTVSGSLHSLIPFSAVSYVLLEGNKIVFKIQLEDSLSRAYIDDVKARVLASVEELAGQEIKKRVIEETILGKFLNDANKNKVESFFNIPLTISGNFVGILNISSVNPGAYKEPELTLLYKIVGKATGVVSSLQTLLDQEQGKFETMIESIVDGVLMLDKDYKVLVHNFAMAECLDINKKTSVNIFDIVGAFSNEFPLQEKLKELFSTNVIQTFNEVKINNKYFQVTLIPIKIGDSVDAAGILLHDQSKETELKRLREDFTAMMVHELRAPLTVIKGTSDLLLKRNDDLEKQKIKDLLSQILQSSGDLLKIVNNVLDAAKAESGKMELIIEDKSINDVIIERVGYFKPLAQQKNINLVYELDDKISKARFDLEKIKRVINNLISNSLKFTSSDGLIMLVTELKDNFVEVSVIDNGKGLSAEAKSKIFTKFVQARETAFSNEEGTGLGLVISKGIVEAHGGKIWVEDNQPRGAKFSFTIPVR